MKKTVLFPLSIAALAGMLFLAAACVNVTYPGLYYDELHQAPSSFFYTGQTPLLCTALTVAGVPVLNMPYSGAVKSAVYGLYMRLFRADFSILSWRLLGILFVGAGLFFLVYALIRKMPPATAYLFIFLFVTDGTILLTTRHDWGPTALALMLRLIVIALLVRDSGVNRVPSTHLFLLSFIVGFAVFEKLSSIVLLSSLVVFTAIDPRRRTVKSILVSIGGFAAGIMPLLLANAYTYFKDHSLISLSPVTAIQDVLPRSFGGFYHYAVNVLSSGNGFVAADFVLGVPTIKTPELFLNVFFVAFSLAFLYTSRNRYGRLALGCIITYLMILVTMYFLPKETNIHHWIIGSPFHYVAFAVAIDTLSKRVKDTPDGTRKIPGIILLLLFALFCIFRGANFIRLEKAFFEKKTSSFFDPALNRLMYFAREKMTGSIFIASVFGVATQMFCGTNGANNTVYEPLWGNYRFDNLKHLMYRNGVRNAYVVVATGTKWNPISQADRILGDMRRLPDWREVSPEDETDNYKIIKLHKFVHLIQ